MGEASLISDLTARANNHLHLNHTASDWSVPTVPPIGKWQQNPMGKTQLICPHLEGKTSISSLAEESERPRLQSPFQTKWKVSFKQTDISIKTQPEASGQANIISSVPFASQQNQSPPR